MDLKWIFSGIGVPVVVGIYWYIRRRIKRRHQPSPVQDLDPMRILKEVADAPLLHRKEIAKRYYGIRVEWSGEVYFISEVWKNRVRLELSVPPGEMGRFKGPSVVFEVDPKHYPGLNLLKDGSVVRFQGVVAKIASEIISLKDAKLLEW
jgi:hypothetical protein